jgi:hypothetical protein
MNSNDALDLVEAKEKFIKRYKKRGGNIYSVSVYKHEIEGYMIAAYLLYPNENLPKEFKGFRIKYFVDGEE